MITHIPTLPVINMNRMLNVLTIILMMITLGCSVSTDNFPEPEKLKIAIAESIEVPFKNVDTLVYQSFIGICGNSSKDELNRYYEPHLNEAPYSKILKAKYSGKILFTGDYLYKLMDSICSNQTESVWSCFSKNKIDLSVSGRALTNQSVEIYERYSLNDEYYAIDKLFEFRDGSWRFEILKEGEAK